MRTVEAWGRSRGAQVVILDAEAANPASRQFYEKRMGFDVQAVVLRKELPPG